MSHVTAPPFSEFLTRFGGSLRTKNLNSPFDVVSKKTTRNRRVFYLHSKSDLPKEFIRQDPWEAEYLYLVAARARLGVVETGRFNGGSSLLMAFANPNVPIHSIDIQPQDDDALRGYIASLNLGANIDLIVGDSQNTKYPQIGYFDLLFIDGDHSYDGCTRDLENWYPDLAPGGHVILHDCYDGSPVMDACIDFIVRHGPIVHISPYKLSNHSAYPTGSLAHFQKPFAAAATPSEPLSPQP